MMVNNNESELTVGHVAKILGVKPSVLRYYDDKGIVEPSRISDAGYRLYTNEDIMRLELVLIMRSVGFSLSTIADVLSRPQVLDTALRDHLSYIEQQIAQLQRVESILKETISTSADKKCDSVLFLLRDVAQIHHLSDEEQQEQLVGHIQKLLTKLAPERGSLTTEQLEGLRTYLFGQRRNATNEDRVGSLSARTSEHLVNAVVRFQHLSEHPEAISKIVERVQPLVNRLKEMPTPVSPHEVWETMMHFRDRVRELALAGVAPDSPEVQSCIDEHIANTARWLNMSLDEYRNWMRDFYKSVAGSEIVQALDSVMKLNNERVQQDIEMKRLLREALEVWRAKNLK
jgi:DNA-binding transcriptional MerR regulator